MDVTVFYAWQNDRDPKLNRYLIQDAAKSAVKRVASDGDVEASPRLDQDTKDVSGTPKIAETIFEKIDACSVFLADVTFVGATAPSNSPEGESKLIPNPNVLIELGYAAKSIEWERIITVMNVAYGNPEQLPFDLRHRRFPIRYNLKESDSPNVVTEKKALSEAIENAIRAIMAGQPLKPEIDLIDSRDGSSLGDTFEIVRPFLRFEPMPPGHHTTYSGIPMPQDDDFANYLDRRNRTLWLRIGLTNRGKTPLPDVVVDLDIRDVEGIRLSPDEPPRAGMVFSPDIRRWQVDASRPVYVDADNVVRGTARVRQRVRVLTPNVREDLVPMGLLAPRADKVIPFSVQLQVTDGRGCQTTYQFVAQIRFDGAQTLKAAAVGALSPDHGI